MRKRVIRRLHSEDSRILRSMILDLHARILDIEIAVGELQRLGPRPLAPVVPVSYKSEVAVS